MKTIQYDKISGYYKYYNKPKYDSHDNVVYFNDLYCAIDMMAARGARLKFFNPTRCIWEWEGELWYSRPLNDRAHGHFRKILMDKHLDYSLFSRINAVASKYCTYWEWFDEQQV